MKSPNLMDLADLTQDQARDYLEKIRWPDGPVCPYCGAVGTAKPIGGKTTSPGSYKCYAGARDGQHKLVRCSNKFTVTTNTVMHRSRIPLKKWLMAFHLICSSKKGISALQLMRNLGLKSYQTAWHMAHRIRHAMKSEPMGTLLRGDVEVDEGYIGGKPRVGNYGNKRTYRQKPKVPIVVLVERGGRARATVVDRVTSDTLRQVIYETTAINMRLITDDLKAYKKVGKTIRFGHDVVRHSRREYLRHGTDIHTNTVEGFIGLFKRGINGAFHHVSKQHLQRYLDEFCFRWDTRHDNDGDRMVAAIRKGDGRRLQYREPRLAGASD